MKPEGSLQFPQDPTAGVYSERDETSQFPILFSHLHIGLPNDRPSEFLTNTLYVFLFSPSVLHAL
jgi:hypothetical protein